MALFGGARRDEEKARAKERVFSFRDDFGQWDPKNSGRSCGRCITVGCIRGVDPGVPVVDWTELDVWHYIARERIGLPGIYFAHEREVVDRGGMLYAVNEFLPLRAGNSLSWTGSGTAPWVTPPATAAVKSDADTIGKVIEEVAATRITERGATRGDDRVSEAAMEDRKREGYF